jgi:aspartate/methionine/tyrosine aminotransferase
MSSPTRCVPTDAHAYPQTVGTAALREAITAWYDRRRGVPGLSVDEVLPTVGSKELVALLPLLLDLGAGDIVVHPRAAYPTYEVGAKLVGDARRRRRSRAVARGHAPGLDQHPGNPDGRVLGVDELRAAVARARELGAVSSATSATRNSAGTGPGRRADPEHPRSARRRTRPPRCAVGVLAQQAVEPRRLPCRLPRRRRDLVSRLLTARKHLGLMLPGPVQSGDDGCARRRRHVAAQRERYRARRDVLRPALVAAGFRIDHSEGGLYLWATEGVDAWKTMDRLADLGILAGPGHFYGAALPEHVRFSLTATDERIAGSGAAGADVVGFLLRMPVPLRAICVGPRAQ